MRIGIEILNLELKLGFEIKIRSFGLKPRSGVWSTNYVGRSERVECRVWSANNLERSERVISRDRSNNLLQQSERL